MIQANPSPAVNAALENLSTRLGRIEASILDDPSKALEVPLLRRDLDSSKDAAQDALNGIQRDVDRQYDLMKWTMGTLVLGMGGLVVNQIVSARKDAKAAD